MSEYRVTLHVSGHRLDDLPDCFIQFGCKLRIERRDLSSNLVLERVKLVYTRGVAAPLERSRGRVESGDQRSNLFRREIRIGD